MSYDFTKIRETLKDVADVRRRTKAAFRIPHHTLEHQRAKEAIPVLWRDHARGWATALHIAYAEARGKTHCNVEAWTALVWDHPGLLKQARALITERAVDNAQELVTSSP